jgi:WD40 repeat protein
MAVATPTHNRLKLTPANSPFLNRQTRSPLRPRLSHEPRLALKRVIGTTCTSPTGFDTVNSSFAYVAGAAVVVVDVCGDQYLQRFYRARPTTLPLYQAATFQNNSSTPVGTPKANDSRGRVAARDSPYSDWDSPSSKTWTSRERVKAATCLALSRDGKYLAVGETGYAPRVLIFNLHDASSDVPLVSINEHAFGVKAVAWSADSRWLATLGAANDGFLYVWRIDPRTGAAKLFQQNRCTSHIRDMVWLGNSLLTLGLRHVKMWKVEEGPAISPTKQRFMSESAPTPPSQRTLPGRNVLLGGLLESTFSCACVDKNRLIICTESGDVCILDDDDKQMKLVKVLNLGYNITSIIIRDNLAYIGGSQGQLSTVDVAGLMEGLATSVLRTTQATNGVLAIGFLTNKLVTIDSNQSIDIWNPDHFPGDETETEASIPIPGVGEAVAGIQPLPKSNKIGASFLTWSGSGKVTFWDLEGRVKLSMDIALDASDFDAEFGLANQLTCAQVSASGKLLATADRQGILRLTDTETKECLLDTKAHSADCLGISMFEDEKSFLMACCGRDRTTQLFHRASDGRIEHFQTLEFNAKVVQVLIPSDDRVVTCSTDRTMQVHDIVCKMDDADTIAAIPSRVIPLKVSPSSMAMSQDGKNIFVSYLDRSFSQFELATGRQIANFKCLDEGGVETTVIDSLCFGNWEPKDQDFLLGCSNTDKSIRLYDANSGSFLDREWGHTEAINGVALIDGEDGSRRVVSVASDATIMIWTLDLDDPLPKSMSRDPSPAKDGSTGRPTLRRVLSKADLAEFQRPTPGSRQSSPPRTLRRRASRKTILTNIIKTPSGPQYASPSTISIAEDTPSRRPSDGGRTASPPTSPKSKVKRRPSLPALGTSVNRKSSGGSTLPSFGSLNMSTEQACRTLRAYRKKLASAEPINAEVLAELDQELRLTASALGDRAIRSKAMNETVLNGLLDQYSERLVTMLDEKMRLSYQPKEQGNEAASEMRSRSLDGDSSESSP